MSAGNGTYVLHSLAGLHGREMKWILLVSASSYGVERWKSARVPHGRV